MQLPGPRLPGVLRSIKLGVGEISRLLTKFCSIMDTDAPVSNRAGRLPAEVVIVVLRAATGTPGSPVECSRLPITENCGLRGAVGTGCSVGGGLVAWASGWGLGSFFEDDWPPFL